MVGSYVGRYWGDREESAVEAAQRIRSTFAAFHDASPLLADWFEKGDSEQARTPVPTDVDGLARLVERGVNRTDFDGEVMTDLGFRVGWWNGRSDDTAASLSVAVGLHAGNPNLSNCVLLDLPDGPDFSTSLVDRLVEIWEPDWATWTTRGLRRAQGRAFREPVGWTTYFRDGDLEDPPAGVVARPLASGTALTFSKPFVDVTGEDAIVLQTWLNGQGVLRPLA